MNYGWIGLGLSGCKAAVACLLKCVVFDCCVFTLNWIALKKMVYSTVETLADNKNVFSLLVTREGFIDCVCREGLCSYIPRRGPEHSIYLLILFIYYIYTTPFIL